MFFQRRREFKSKLVNEKSFYAHFLNDLVKCKSEVIIESPFITSTRMELLYPVLKKLITRKVPVYFVTRDPVEYDDEYMKYQATNEILQCIELGINITLLKGYHHRKLAIIDKKILWEGSLNILSFSNSQEIMRRIEGESFASQMFTFLKLGRVIY